MFHNPELDESAEGNNQSENDEDINESFESTHSDNLEGAQDEIVEPDTEGRPKSNIRKPTWHNVYDMNAEFRFFSISEDMITFEEAVTNENASEWKKEWNCDDLWILGTNQKTINKLKEILKENLSMKDLEVISQYLGVNIKQNLNNGCSKLSEVEYLKILWKNLVGKTVNTPIEVNIDLKYLINETQNIEMHKVCRKIIGSLVYAAFVMSL